MNHRALVVCSLLAPIANADVPPPLPSATPIEVEATPIGSGAVTTQRVPVAPPRHARAEALAMSGLTLTFIGVSFYSLHRMSNAADAVNDLYNHGEVAAWQVEARHQANWQRFAFACTAAAVVSAAVSAYLWTRAEASYQVAVTPSGAYVGYARTF